MRCLREIINQWSEYHHLDVEWDEFDVRSQGRLPDLSYDIYLSSGGPGSPLESEGAAWDTAYFNWLESVEAWNADGARLHKKFVFFICHSFQLACRHYHIGTISKRRSTSFGVFPVHVLLEGQNDPVFAGLPDPFYVVDSRDWQVTEPGMEKLRMRGMDVLCVEKYREHVPLPQAVMSLRFNQYMMGTQFHPEADAVGMSIHLQTDEKKKSVIENFGEEKWRSMIAHLNDPDKIMWTYTHVLPNFLNGAAHQLLAVKASPLVL